MPQNDRALEEIKSRVDIVDLISEYISLKKAGQNWKGLCPFHTEKTPSFTVSPAKQIYHCFGCGSGGDIFSFLMQYESLTFPEVLRTLAKKSGVALAESPKIAAQAGTKEALVTIHGEALGFFRQNLKNTPAALRYLNSRGIDAKIQDHFSLGYALKSWNSLLLFLKKKGHTDETILKAGLASRGRSGLYDTFRDRLIFPIIDLKGDVVAFGGRAINGAEPKYLNSPETLIFNKSRVLYGLNLARDFIKKNGHVLFMEGYMDVISAVAHGFGHSVAPLGTAFTAEHGKLIKRFTQNVILIFDSDIAGVKAAKRAAALLLENGLNVRVLVLPGKDDPDSFLRKKNGTEAFRRMLETPLSVVDFLVMQKGDRHVLGKEALEIISRVPNRVLQGQYVKALSEGLDVEERYVREELLSIRKLPRSGIEKSAPANLPNPGKRPLDEVYIIKLLLQLPEQVERFSRILTDDYFKDTAVRGIFNKIIDGLNDFNVLLATCDNKEKALLTEISLMEDFEDPDKALRDCIKRVKMKRRSVLLHQIRLRIKDAEQNKDAALLRELQLEQCEILKARGE